MRSSTTSGSGRSRWCPAIAWSSATSPTAVCLHAGSRRRFELVGAAEGVLADTSFVRFHTQLKAVRSMRERWRLIARGELGFLDTRELDDVPVKWRFFAGATTPSAATVFQSVGPVDSEGDVTGGDRLAVASLEAERRVRERWAMALFVDAGSVTEGGLGSDVELGVGIGARWFSPLGPIRVTWAFPSVRTAKTVCACTSPWARIYEGGWPWHSLGGCSPGRATSCSA